MKIMALNFGVFWKPKIAKNFLHEFGTTFLNGLCLKLEKRPSKGQKRTLTWNCLSISQCYILRNFQQFCQIWSKLQFSKIFLHLAIKKWQNIHKFALEFVKNPDSNLQFICPLFSGDPFTREIGYLTDLKKAVITSIPWPTE